MPNGRLRRVPGSLSCRRFRRSEAASVRAKIVAARIDRETGRLDFNSSRQYFCSRKVRPSSEKRPQVPSPEKKEAECRLR